MLDIKVVTIFFIWVLLLSNPPFSFYLVDGFPYLITKFVSVFFLLALLVYKNKYKLSYTNNIIFVIILLNALFYFFSLLYHQDSSTISQIVPMFFILVIYLSITNICGVVMFVKSYIILMIAIGLSGSFAFFLGLLGKAPDLGFVGSPEIHSINYFFTFSNAVFNRAGNFQLIRIAGYFDEPGTFAFYITFALLMNQLLYKNRNFERLLIFSGLFTLSIAFYITVFLQFMFYPNWVRKYLKLLIFLVLLLLAVDVVREDYPIINIFASATIDRFEQSDDGVIKGDNRSVYFEQGIGYFKEKPLLGYGKQNILTDSKFFGYDPSSFVGFLVFYGLIGTFIIFLIYLYQFKYLFRIDNGLIIDHFILKIVFIQFLLFIQRPLINVPLAFVLLILMIELMDQRKNRLIPNKDE